MVLALSTQARELADFLIKRGYQVFLTKEPTKNSKSAKKIRQGLNKQSKISPQKLQELFAKDRKEHLTKEIIPNLKARKIVICDRYFFSSFAYGMADGLKLHWLLRLNKDFLTPDLTILLKVKPEICLLRIKKRAETKTLFEKQEKLEKVWQNYKFLAKDKFRDNITIVDGEKPIKKVFSQIKEIAVKQLDL